MIFAILAAVLLAWLVWALFENGPSLAAASIVALLAWALIDLAG